MKMFSKTGLIISLLAFGCIASPAIAAEPKTLQEVYTQAVNDFKAANYPKALAGFQQFLEKQPRHPYALNYQAKCLQKIKAGANPEGGLEGKVSRLVIPSVEFKDTALETVFEYLTAKSEELSGGKVVANFIYQGTEEERKNTLITLQLKNAPMTEVIRYVGNLSRTRFSYDKYAILATPLRAVAAKPVEKAEGKEPGFKIEVPKDPFAKQ